MGIKTRNFANNILSGGTIDGTDFLSGTLPSSNITNDSAASVTSIPSISNVVSPVAGDPPSPTLGDIWYNSSTNALKFQGLQTAAWASGGTMPVARSGSMTAGTLTAAITATGGGDPGTSPRLPSESFSYDGSTWTSTPSYNQGRTGGASFGLKSAAAITGGYAAEASPAGDTDEDLTEEWDDSTWTSGVNLNTGRRGFKGGAGTQTAGMVGGGEGPIPTKGNLTEEYNGSAWTTSNTQNTARYAGALGGSQTAAVLAGGQNDTPTQISETEEYDGTSWTVGNNMAEQKYQASGFGTQTDMVAAAGRTAPPTSIVLTSQVYDGTSWAASATSSNTFTQRSGNQGGGSTPSSTGFIVGGDNGPSYSTATEEYTGGGSITKTFTTD